MQESCFYIYAQFAPIMISKMFIVHKAVVEQFLGEGIPAHSKAAGRR